MIGSCELKARVEESLGTVLDPDFFGQAEQYARRKLDMCNERAGRALVWYHCTEGDPSLPCDPADETDCFQYGYEHTCQYRDAKPEGVAVELADAVIRIADLCGYLGIDLDTVISEKMAYNETRPFKHGKRF
jgi:hypothetical protein